MPMFVTVARFCVERTYRALGIRLSLSFAFSNTV